MARPSADIRGRGANDNPRVRFEALRREPEPSAETLAAVPVTVVATHEARSIMIANRFELACRRLGLNATAGRRLDTRKFRVPGPEQLRLL